MACDIRKYKSMDLGGGDSEMALTAFVGGVKGRSAIQFTIGSTYCAMSEDQLLDLIETIMRRIKHLDGYTATGHEREDINYKA